MLCFYSWTRWFIQDIYFISQDKICVLWTQNFIFWASLVFRPFAIWPPSYHSIPSSPGSQMSTQEMRCRMWPTHCGCYSFHPFCHPGNYRWLWQQLDFGHQKWKPCLVSSSVRWHLPPSWTPCASSVTVSTREDAYMALGHLAKCKQILWTKERWTTSFETCCWESNSGRVGRRLRARPSKQRHLRHWENEEEEGSSGWGTPDWADRP